MGSAGRRRWGEEGVIPLFIVRIGELFVDIWLGSFLLLIGSCCVLLMLLPLSCKEGEKKGGEEGEGRRKRGVGGRVEGEVERVEERYEDIEGNEIIGEA